MEVLKIKQISLKSILSIAKHTFKTLRIIYIIEGFLLALSLFSNNFFSQFTLGIDLISMVSILLTANFISHIIVFSLQISKEHGNLLFLTPINGIEFILGHLLELITINLLIITITTIVGSLNTNTFTSFLTTSSFFLFIGLITAHLIISAFICIVSSYIKNTGLCVLAVIICCGIAQSIYFIFSKVILSFLPYFYVSVNIFGTVHIDIFSVVLNIIAIVTLQLIAAYMIDKKLDIY